MNQKWDLELEKIKKHLIKSGWKITQFSDSDPSQFVASSEGKKIRFLKNWLCQLEASNVRDISSHSEGPIATFNHLLQKSVLLSIRPYRVSDVARWSDFLRLKLIEPDANDIDELRRTIETHEKNLGYLCAEQERSAGAFKKIIKKLIPGFDPEGVYNYFDIEDCESLILAAVESLRRWENQKKADDPAEEVSRPIWERVTRKNKIPLHAPISSFSRLQRRGRMGG